MGYRPRNPHDHRKGKACQACIAALEISLGLRRPPRPPTDPPSCDACPPGMDVEFHRQTCPNVVGGE